MILVAGVSTLVVTGVSHNLQMKLLAPVLTEFIGGETDATVPGNIGRANP